MNNFQVSSKDNPFTYPLLWGRNSELKAICRSLLSRRAYSCAIIGETSFGKTTLLRYLADPHNALMVDNINIHSKCTFIYFDCVPYGPLVEQSNASSQFWWDLYNAVLTVILPSVPPEVSEPKRNVELEQEDKVIDDIIEIKIGIKKLVQSHSQPVVIILDNFEIVASLPVRDSEWLRALAQHNCTYVVASRYQLYLLYHPKSSVYHKGSTIQASPLWNLFSDPIYLGLMAEDEVEVFLVNASLLAKNAGSVWTQKDIDFVRKIAGRHPELLRITCKHLFEQRLLGKQINENRMYEYLRFIIAQEVNSVCEQLWRGLEDYELEIELRIVRENTENTTQGLSLLQEVLILVAKGQSHDESPILFKLEQRGLIEWVGERWQIFSEIMQQVVLKHELLSRTEIVDSESKAELYNNGTAPPGKLKQSQNSSSLPSSSPDITTQQTDSSIQIQERKSAPPFTYLEGRVYAYLLSHIGQVCSREELMNAIWQGRENRRSSSALQKIIERIRDKLELDGEHSSALIAVRGQGYMLREKIGDTDL